jgi:hypothetical protein
VLIKENVDTELSDQYKKLSLFHIQGLTLQFSQLRNSYLCTVFRKSTLVSAHTHTQTYLYINRNSFNTFFDLTLSIFFIIHLETVYFAQPPVQCVTAVFPGGKVALACC